MRFPKARAPGFRCKVARAGKSWIPVLRRSDLASRWEQGRLVDLGAWQTFDFGAETFYAITSPSGEMLTPTGDCRSPGNANEALAFAVSLKETRAIDSATPLHDALYVERLSRLLPTYSISAPVPDDLVLGGYLTGGAQVSVLATRRMRSLLTWLSNSGLREIIRQAGLESAVPEECASDAMGVERRAFTLAGRPALEQFFREQVLDIIENADSYRQLGIGFPGAIVLHGPPGCGKTFAVERLIEYLGWPSLSIDSSSVASPFIHETSRKVAQVFEQAIREAPTVIKIDEMEAFLTDRETAAGSGHHRIEEVGEFLRRIPEAVQNNVLVIGMTNRMEMIDQAILRRGRFDHIVQVDMPSREEVEGLLRELLGKVPTESLEFRVLSEKLVGRPLSDVDFVVREGARLAVRAKRVSIDQLSLEKAIQSAPARGPEQPRKIGFV
jgi:cell division protease FtsH